MFFVGLKIKAAESTNTMAPRHGFALAGCGVAAVVQLLFHLYQLVGVALPGFDTACLRQARVYVCLKRPLLHYTRIPAGVPVCLSQAIQACWQANSSTVPETSLV